MAVQKFDHIHFTVRDIGAAMTFFNDTLGARFIGPIDRSLDRNESRQCKYAFNTEGVELVSPQPGDSLYQILEKEGEGISHIGYKALDIDSSIAAIEAKGVKLWRKGEWRGIKFAVFDKEGAHGVRLEVVEYKDIPAVAVYNADKMDKLPWYNERQDTGIERLDHIHVTVKDIEKAMKFFSDVLGTQFIGPLDRSVDPEEPRDCLYAFDNGILELVSPKPSDPLYKILETQGEGISHIGWKSYDIDKTTAIIESKGVKLWRKGEYHNIKYAVFDKQDTFGVRIELVQYEDIPAVAAYNAGKIGELPWFNG